MTAVDWHVTPGRVDAEIESVGSTMRDAIWGLLAGDLYNTPDEVREVFEALLGEVAVARGWTERIDGSWFWTPKIRQWPR